jgi:hypothetical protein
MRFRTTLILAVICAALGAYLYFVERGRVAEEEKKKKLVELEEEDVRKVSLTYADRKIVVEKTDGQWKVTEPIQDDADETTVKNLINAIADCEVKRTLDDVPEDLTPFGLKEPFVTVEVSLKDGELPAIQVGKNTPVGFSAYVKKADDSKIHLAGSVFRSGMDKQLKDLRDKRIVKLEDADVRKIVLERPEEKIVLAKKDDQWQIDEPASYAADSSTVQTFLSSLRSMRATDFPQGENLSDYGLDNPGLKLTLFVGKDEDEKAILVAKDKEGDKTYVKGATRPTIYEVGSWVYTDLDKKLNDFRDKTLLSFEKEAVTLVKVDRHDGAGFTLKLSGENAWTVENVQGEVQQNRLDQYVSDLRDLKGYEILADAPEDLAAYGLDAPRLTITVQGQDAAPLGTVRIGSYSDDDTKTAYAAKRDDQATVLRLRDYVFTRLDKKVSDLLPAPTATTTVKTTPTPTKSNES